MAKVAIILAQGFADWEYALVAGAGRPFYGLNVRFFTPEPGVIRSQGGLAAEVSLGLDEALAWSPEVLAVVGGVIWLSEDAPDLGGLLRKQYTEGRVAAGICGGTVALARAGLLDETPHTSNDADFLIQHAPEYAGSAFFRQQPRALSENRIITAPGTAPVSFAAEVFTAAGVDRDTVAEFRRMLAAEHA